MRGLEICKDQRIRPGRDGHVGGPDVDVDGKSVEQEVRIRYMTLRSECC